MASSNHLTSLALTLGVIRDGNDDPKHDAVAANTTVTDISSEASEPMIPRSDDDLDVDPDGSNVCKKRKKHQRHTAQQI
ncbi:hypothetical protein M8C21_016109, partial [Ambrosia artemisiifolia]